MKEFLMIFRIPQTNQQASAEQVQARMQLWQNWIKEIASDGKFVGTNRLVPEGKIVKPNQLVTDGPYAEAKEMVGGYMVVKAASLDEAVQMAKGCPVLGMNGHVEVRAVLPMEQDANSKQSLDTKAAHSHA